MAAGITAVVCLALTMFALQTKWDFTILGGALFVGVIILFVFGIIVAFIPGKTAQIAYASAGALLFSVGSRHIFKCVFQFIWLFFQIHGLALHFITDLSHLRYPNDDGWEAQVQHFPRGVHFCCPESLSGYH